jgi:branched-chain amino acid transport system ATP-binding protein
MAGEYVLQTQGLTKEFRGFTAVKNVNLNVRRGSIHALIGPNGAGKTTCFNLITKFLPATAGRIFYEGRDITSVPAHDIARLGLGRSFQISAVFPCCSGKSARCRDWNGSWRNGLVLQTWSGMDVLRDQPRRH